MTYTDPDLDPRRPAPGDPAVTETVVTGPAVTESVETVVVRESNTGWWLAGILAALVLLAVLWILFAGGAEPGADEALLDARLDAAEAQARADAAQVQGQVAGAQASVEVARANAAAAEAEARAAQARAAEPVVIEREVPVPVPAPSEPAVVTPTSPQN